jgi:hypothetical protein
MSGARPTFIERMIWPAIWKRSTPGMKEGR